MAKNEELLRAWRQYERENNHTPSSAREAVEWAVGNGFVDLPEIDPLDELSEQMSRALREETAVDSKGRRYRVNACVRVTKKGVQYALWANGDYCSPSHTEQWFAQRREQIVSDCFKLKVDVDHYNDTNQHNRQYVLDLDFTEDVAEREMGDAAA